MIEITVEDEGRVGMIVPQGVFFRGAAEGKICRKMLEDNLLEAVIGLLANLLFVEVFQPILLLKERKSSKWRVLGRDFLVIFK